MSALALAFAFGAPALFGACSSSSFPPPPPVGSSGGGACAAAPGVFPASNCDNTDESCAAPSPSCPTAPCNAASPCLALADNTGKPVDDLRLRKLYVTAPPRLALQFVQGTVIDQGINLHGLCGEGGDGSFSWLLHLDTNAGTLVTGGAPPTTDPLHAGYCFVNATIGALNVKPVTVHVTKAADGSWSSDVIDKLNVPIYVQGDLNNVVVLPLSKTRVEGLRLSFDGNCIGSYNPSGVTAPGPTGVCSDQDPRSCQRWHSAGSLGGYITLKDAEGVNVQTLSKTLCAFLTGSAAANCMTDADGNIAAAGDFCSQTDAPADDGGICHDAFWLSGTFAASAALINDGSTVPSCNGSLLSDGGPSADGGAESSADASGD
jgi:hypothetical protein